MTGKPTTRTLPLLPLRDIIVFPHMVVPLFVGREKSVSALEEAMATDKELFLSAQKKAKTNDPREEEIFPVGTIGHIIQLLRLPDGTVKVLVEGKARAEISRFESATPHFVVEATPLVEPDERSVELAALVRSVQGVFETYVKLNKRIPPEMLMSVQTIEEPGRLADTIVAHVNLKLKDKQELLETTSPTKRLERLYELMQAEIEILQVEKKIRTRVKKQMEKSQKEYYLNEQMQAIQKELGDRDEFKNELAELEAKIKAKRMSKEAKERCGKELKKLKMMSPMSAEATVVRNYLDWILALPWDEKSEDRHDITEAERILDAEHYGLQKVKERILEYLAVQALVDRMRGPILCLVGPPGVGKTSLARSIAHATGRKFVRQSLGGVRDEAEIRGHRRTYIGALPGKIAQSLKKVGTNNPVFLLDEIDKMAMDFRGDPAAALLEVLDPEQNNTFNDHYLDLDYDLSDVMFITTANNQHAIPLPLQDRLEIIELPGYTEWEKIAIARQYLIPKQAEANGIAGPGRQLRPAQELPGQGRHPRPLPRGRDPQGRPERRHHDGDRDGVGADAGAGAPELGDDRRGHAARSGPADRRPQGEDPGRPSRRRHHGLVPRGQREGPEGHPSRGPGRAHGQAGQAHGRGPADRAPGGQPRRVPARGLGGARLAGGRGGRPGRSPGRALSAQASPEGPRRRRVPGPAGRRPVGVE
jgi:ATP-dependent Lon protease